LRRIAGDREWVLLQENNWQVLKLFAEWGKGNGRGQVKGGQGKRLGVKDSGVNGESGKDRG